MTHEAHDMDSIPLRVNDLERSHTLTDHRLRVLEEEKLPHRVGDLEKSVQYLVSMAETSEETNRTVIKMNAFVRGGVYVIGGLMAALTLVVAIYGVAPKFDAMIIDKNPQVTRGN
ncbi:hypothetical protein [Alcanivorax jadensis]|jgi:hypothetical protein|nr:hypothetical protein [Alcanivorax jadensis]